MCNSDDNIHDQDIALIHTQLHLDEFLHRCQLGVGGNHEGVGGSQEVSGIVGGIGGFSGSPGEMAEGIGGKGVEFHDEHIGMVWRFEEDGGRKGGSGMDSSAESRGMEGVCRIGHNGIDKVEDCRNRSEGCGVDFVEESNDGIGGLRNCSMSGELHINIF